MISRPPNNLSIVFNHTRSSTISQQHNSACGGSSADQGKQLSYNVLDTAGLFVERQRGRGGGECGGGSNGDGGGGGTATASAAAVSNGGCGVGGAATESAATAAPAAALFTVQNLHFATLCKIALSNFNLFRRRKKKNTVQHGIIPLWYSIVQYNML